MSGRLVGDAIDALRLGMDEISRGTGTTTAALAKYRLPLGRGRKMPTWAVKRLIAFIRAHCKRLLAYADTLDAQIDQLPAKRKKWCAP